MTRRKVLRTLCSTFLVLAAVLLASTAGQIQAETEEVATFQRGDVSVNGRVDMFDAFELLDYLFLEEPPARLWTAFSGVFKGIN